MKDFIKAVKYGNLKKVKELYTKDLCLDLALHEASSNGHLEIVKFLVENGADVQSEDNYSLRWAVIEGHLEVVKYLVSRGADQFAYDSHAIKTATLYKNYEIIEFLMENITDQKHILLSLCKTGDLELVKKYINFLNKDEIALGIAADKNHFNIVEYLINNGYDVQYSNNIALTLASDSGHLEMVKYLVSKGASVDDNDNYAIEAASDKGHLKIVKYLLDNGASPTDRAFYLACKNGKYTTVELLFKNGANINTNDVLTGASKNDHENVVQFLLNKGMYTNTDYNRALTIAVNNGCLNIVKQLLDKIEIEHINQYSVVIAIRINRLDIFELFLEKGFDMNKNNGYILRYAAESCEKETVKYLIRKGADVELAIKHCYSDTVIKKLEQWSKPQRLQYNGPINERTETQCAICLLAMNNIQELLQCTICMKCLHTDCYKKWDGNCVYCNN